MPLKENFSVPFPLEISQNSQENTCERVSCLIKLQASVFLTEHNFSILTAATFFLQHLFLSLFEKKMHERFKDAQLKYYVLSMLSILLFL